MPFHRIKYGIHRRDAFSMSGSTPRFDSSPAGALIESIRPPCLEDVVEAAPRPDFLAAPARPRHISSPPPTGGHGPAPHCHHCVPGLLRLLPWRHRGHPGSDSGDRDGGSFSALCGADRGPPAHASNTWWIYVLAAMAGDYWPHHQGEGSVGFVLLAEVANAVRALVAATGVRLLCRRLSPFHTLRDMVVFLVFAAILGPSIGAFIGAARCDDPQPGDRFLARLAGLAALQYAHRPDAPPDDPDRSQARGELVRAHRNRSHHRSGRAAGRTFRSGVRYLDEFIRQQPPFEPVLASALPPVGGGTVRAEAERSPHYQPSPHGRSGAPSAGTDLSWRYRPPRTCWNCSSS